MAAPASTFLLMVKRQKSTIFFEVNKTDTVGSLRKQIEFILKKPLEEFALVKVEDDTKFLEDDKTMEALKMAPDGVLGLVYKTEMGWEDLQIVPVSAPNPLPEPEAD
eukprot:comp11711_c0_seq1/m.6278 comp11711_c0_seq1/g.6278  ORF comp11711_c0_seq1/g.6278 comp11711_c0_seq1/m.6278 type:complete len:107 (-) comp11711_c0_seq1:476-796(-)